MNWQGVVSGCLLVAVSLVVLMGCARVVWYRRNLLHLIPCVFAFETVYAVIWETNVRGSWWSLSTSVLPGVPLPMNAGIITWIVGMLDSVSMNAGMITGIVGMLVSWAIVATFEYIAAAEARPEPVHRRLHEDDLI